MKFKSILAVAFLCIVAVQTEAQTKRSIAYLWTRFETGDRPSQTDFRDFMASFLHYQDSLNVSHLVGIDTLSQDATLADSSSRKIVSQAAIKAYVDNAVATGLTVGDKGEIDVVNIASDWQVDTSAITTIKIATDAVTAAKIATGEVGASELASTAVTPGSYTTASITVDADGRITAASTGTGDNLGNHIATQDLDMGASDIFNLTEIRGRDTTSANSVDLNIGSGDVTNTSGNGGNLVLSGGSTGSFVGAAGSVVVQITENGGGANSNFNLKLPSGDGGYTAGFDPNSITANRVYTLPDASGTLALTTGGTLAGVSALSTDATKSTYTMSSTIPVNFKSSDGNTLLYLNETNEMVGVGTTNPTEKLEVNGNLKISSDGVGAYAGSNDLVFYGTTSVSAQTDQAVIRTNIYPVNSNGGNLEFWTSNTSNVLTQRMVINGAGNVGIGTTSPDRLLHAEVSDAVTNAVTYAQRLSHITSGTATTGFGVGLEFGQEGGDGANDVTATIQTIATDVAAGSEDASLQISLIKGGSMDTVSQWLSTGQAKWMEYGAHAFTGTPTEFIAVTADGSVIERTPAEVLSDIGGVSAGNAWVLNGQNITAESSIGSNDAFGVNLETNNTNRLRFSSAGRMFGGTLTDVILTPSDSVKLSGARIDLAATSTEVQITAAAQTALVVTGGLHSAISARSGNASGNSHYLWENSADADNSYRMSRSADGDFDFVRSVDYPYGADTDTVFVYDEDAGTFNFKVTNLQWNGTNLPSSSTMWALGGNTLGANNSIGSNDAFRVAIETNGTDRLRFGSTGRVYSNTITDFIMEPSDSAKISATTIDLAGAVLVTGTFGATSSALIAGRLQTAMGANVASAGDMTLGTDGNVFHITGTTTINGIAEANWQSGSQIILMFDGVAITVTDSGSPGSGFLPFALSGGIDFSATQNDVIFLVKDGSTAWREVSRTIN